MLEPKRMSQQKTPHRETAAGVRRGPGRDLALERALRRGGLRRVLGFARIPYRRLGRDERRGRARDGQCAARSHEKLSCGRDADGYLDHRDLSERRAGADRHAEGQAPIHLCGVWVRAGEMERRMYSV